MRWRSKSVLNATSDSVQRLGFRINVLLSYYHVTFSFSARPVSRLYPAFTIVECFLTEAEAGFGATGPQMCVASAPELVQRATNVQYTPNLARSSQHSTQRCTNQSTKSRLCKSERGTVTVIVCALLQSVCHSSDG